MYIYKTKETMAEQENISLVVNCANSEVQQTHTHEFIEFVYILSGKGQHKINNVGYEVERGDTVFINIGQTHSFQSVGEMKYVNCILLPEFMSNELADSENVLDILSLSFFDDFDGKIEKLTPKVSFRGDKMIEVEEIIKMMLKEFSGKELGYKSILKGYLTVYLSKILREMRGNDIVGITRHITKISPDILKYIEENYSEQITLTELAQKCFYNPSYFSRVFKECYGKKLTDYIHEKRIAASMRLLRETALSVEQISTQVGYQEKRQFYKMFRRYTGVTPRNYRFSDYNKRKHDLDSGTPV